MTSRDGLAVGSRRAHAGSYGRFGVGWGKTGPAEIEQDAGNVVHRDRRRAPREKIGMTSLVLVGVLVLFFLLLLYDVRLDLCQPYVYTAYYNIAITGVPPNTTTGTLAHNEAWGGTKQSNRQCHSSIKLYFNDFAECNHSFTE